MPTDKLPVYIGWAIGTGRVQVQVSAALAGGFGDISVVVYRRKAEAEAGLRAIGPTNLPLSIKPVACIELGASDEEIAMIVRQMRNGAALARCSEE